MAEEKVFNGVRSGDTWLAKGPITLPQAEDLIEKHLRGANKDSSWDLEEEGDHLVMVLDQESRTLEKTRSDKRTEYPNP